MIIEDVLQPPKEIFRMYDIRGTFGKTLTVDIVRDIGRALASRVLQTENSIVVGRDGRLSGSALNQALIDGILSTGCHVVDIGMVPTPVLYFATHYLPVSSGVMLTGSHNPVDDNGLKMIVGGSALYGEDITALYEAIKTRAFCEGQGACTRKDLLDPYIQSVQQSVRLQDCPLKVVVDCGNGAAGIAAPRLYRALGCEIIPLFCEIDGRFPNHHPDPGQPVNLSDLQKAVQEQAADIGLAFDGDGDRLGVVDNQGNIIWPDRQLMLFARELLLAHPEATIIFDVKCTRHVVNLVEQLGGRALMWKTGHSLIKAKMQETGALLAGEMSGHFFFKDRWFGFDDALYAGARLLEVLSKHHGNAAAHPKTAAEIFCELPDSVNTPEIVIPVIESQKFEYVRKLTALAQFPDAEVSTIDGLRVDFKDGFGLVRPSNTGSNLILRFEGDTINALNRIQSQFRDLLRAVDSHWQLTF